MSAASPGAVGRAREIPASEAEQRGKDAEVSVVTEMMTKLPPASLPRLNGNGVPSDRRVHAIGGSGQGGWSGVFCTVRYWNVIINLYARTTSNGWDIASFMHSEAGLVVIQ